MKGRAAFFGLEQRIVEAIGVNPIDPEGSALIQDLKDFFDNVSYKSDLRFTNLIDAPESYLGAQGKKVGAHWRKKELVFQDPDDPDEINWGEGRTLVYHTYDDEYQSYSHGSSVAAAEGTKVYDPFNMSDGTTITFRSDGHYEICHQVSFLYLAEISGDGTAASYFENISGCGYQIDSSDEPAPRCATSPFTVGATMVEYGGAEGDDCSPAGHDLDLKMNANKGDSFDPVIETYCTTFGADGNPDMYRAIDFMIYKLGGKLKYS